MIKPAITRSCCGALLLLCAIPVAPAHAQVESGRVIDDSIEAPLVGSRVVLQHDSAGAWSTVETTQTDAQGLFQFMPHPPGIYRVALVGKKDPMFVGAIDTLAADSMQQREFRLPITRRSVASAYQAAEVEHPAEAIVTGPRYSPDPASQRLASAATSISVQYVVNPDGSVDPQTLHMSGAGDPNRDVALQQSVLSRKYHPATIGGIPVRQLVDTRILMETRVERVERVR